MTLPVDALFGGLDESPSEVKGSSIRNKKEAAFEERTVKFMLKHLGIPDQLKKLKKRNIALSYGDDLKHRAFRDMFTTFPLRLESSTLNHLSVGKATGSRKREYSVEACAHFQESSRFKNFRKFPAVAYYDELLEAVPDSESSQPFGLVFPRRGVTGGLVIHNDKDEQFWSQGSAWVFKGDQDRETRYYIQPLIDMLASIVDSGWTP